MQHPGGKRHESTAIVVDKRKNFTLEILRRIECCSLPEKYASVRWESSNRKHCFAWQSTQLQQAQPSLQLTLERRVFSPLGHTESCESLAGGVIVCTLRN
ncbi:hypothetical protein PInf_018802 [Phytophthora infestans]|nr:hypothetical protein PInf_018802 [Phytophthora infestans]